MRERLGDIRGFLVALTQLSIKLHEIHRRTSALGRRFTTLLAVGMLSAAASTSLQAQTFNSSFGGAGFTCVNPTQPGFCVGTANNRSASVLLSAGDSFNQSIIGSNLSSVTSLKLNLNFINVLQGASNIQFAILLNGTVVGNTPLYGANGFNEFVAPFNLNFQSISAATYDVKLLVSAATIPNNGEGFGMFTDGASTIQLGGIAASTTVPEPGTSLLMMAGLAGVAAIVRITRVRKQA